MPRLAVVLDTNAYRSIGEAAFEPFRRDEVHHSVIPYASYFVASELLAHLSDPGDPDFRHCLAATTRLGRHCRRYDGSRYQVDFLQLPVAQVARTLFGRTLETDRASSAAYGDVIGAITDNPEHGVLNEWKEPLTKLREIVLLVEREFVERLWSRVVLTLAPDAEDWQSIVRSPRRSALIAALEAGQGLDLVAGTIVDRVAAKCGLVLSQPEREAAIANARKVFATPVYHHDLLVRQLIANGPDMSQPDRANSIWDHEITFSTGVGATMIGVPLVLVTGDSLVRQAAEAAGTRRQIWTLAEYRERITQRDVYVDSFLT